MAEEATPREIPLTARPRPRRDLPSERYEDELILVEPESSVMHALTGVGPFLWERMDGETSVEALISALCERYEVEEPRARADVLAFLGSLVEQGLVEI